jgi:predicted branched-subunit amino acid permease
MIKPQDLVFLVLLAGVLVRRSARLATILGLSCLALAMPLFWLKILFTAERLTWYAGALLFYSVLKQLYENRH